MDPNQTWEERGCRGRWGVILGDVDGQEGQRHKVRMTSHAGNPGIRWDQELGWKEGGGGSLATPSTGLESDRPGFKSWLCCF